jgi:excisionase family DNA binding protein
VLPKRRPGLFWASLVPLSAAGSKVPESLEASFGAGTRKRWRSCVVAEPLLLTVHQAHPIAGIGRDAMYELVRTGRIRSIAVGRKRLIPRSELEAWIQRELLSEETS